jgi:hypothetical protein
MQVTHIGLQPGRHYSKAELREIATFNRLLVHRFLPEIEGLLAELGAKPRTIVVFDAPADIAERYKQLLQRYA